MPETLTDDEYTVLMLVEQGQTIGPIGRWEKPVKDLHSRGLLNQFNAWNYGKTDAGSAVLAEHEKGVDIDLALVLSGTNRLAIAASEARVAAEEAAKHLANAVRISSKVTGDKTEVAARAWAESIVKRALELV